MTFRLESERMLVSVLLAAAFHVVALFVVQLLLDVDRDLHSSPERLTVQLIAADVPSRISEKNIEPSVLIASMQENVMSSVRTPDQKEQPVVPVSPATEPKIVSISKPELIQESAKVGMESKPENGNDDSSTIIPVASWVPTLQRPVDAVPVRGRGGLSALSPPVVGTSTGGRSGATVGILTPLAGKIVGVGPSGEYKGRSDLVPAYNDGLTLLADEAVYAISSSGSDTVAPSLQGVSPDRSILLSHNAGFLGQQRMAAPPVIPVRRSGSPTIKLGDADRNGTRGLALSATSVITNEPGFPEISSQQAMVEVAMAIQSGDVSPIIEVNRLAQLDQVLRDGGSSRDPAVNSGAVWSLAQPGASGQPLLGLGGKGGLRLPEGIEVSASLGLRRLVAVTTPVLPDGIPSEIVRSTVRVHIVVDPQGWVRPLGFSPDSGSTALNNEIYAALRKWRYESVKDQQPVRGTINIEIRTRST